MTELRQTYDVERLQDLFYRCKFSEVIRSIEAVEAETGELPAELALMKANSYFELHRVKEAKEILKSIRKSSDGFDPNYLYALARVCYLDGDAPGARTVSEEIYRNTDQPTHKFKSLLTTANTYYSQRDYTKVPVLIEKLCTFEPLDKDDEKISLLIFLGNYYFASGSSNDLAKNYFKKALAISAGKTWTFFMARCLYGMAAIHEKAKEHRELMWTLDILQSFVDESEQLFFSHVVNDKFKNYFSINTPVEFDTDNRRILIKNRWLPFHEKPMLFKFLLLLHDAGKFVSKESIATRLWPEESYKPRVHDPRIFDIAKRTRHMIEAYENQPVVLLSGRMGYKLASV